MKRLLRKFNILHIITKSIKSWIHYHEQAIVLKIEFFWPTRKLCEITQMGPLWLYNSQTRAERRSFSAMIALYSSPILTVHPWRAHVQQQQYTLLLLFLKYTVCVEIKEHYWHQNWKIIKLISKNSLKSGVASNHHSRLQKKKYPPRIN